MNNYSIAKEFGNYIIDKLDDDSFVLVIQELEVFLANYEIVKKTYEVSNYTGTLIVGNVEHYNSYTNCPQS